MRTQWRLCVSVYNSIPVLLSELLVQPLTCEVIQQKKQRPSCFWKLLDHGKDTPQYAAPVISLDTVKETQTTTTALRSPKVPTVRTTLPGEDFNEKHNALVQFSESSISSIPITDAASAFEKRQQPPESTQPKKPRQSTHEVFVPPSKARKFHLINTPSSASSPFLAPKTIAQKHRDRRKKDLAVFAEKPDLIRKEKLSGDISQHSSGEPRHAYNGEKKDGSQLEEPRKRPNATAAERKWRTETWANPPKPNAVTGDSTRTAENINEPSNQWNYESAKLAEQLQEVALEEIHASEEKGKGLSTSGQLKIKLKPPKPRQPGAGTLGVDSTGNDLMTDVIALDNDDEYVLDTYVRSSTQPTGPHYDSLHDVAHSNVGILIIEGQEEEAFWEAFAEDRQSDPEWNSEEEDENGL